ncbi:MAG: hypothetical protein H0T79_11365 [Deltaproteobacteria bacterium]|nr:hypothetical protein [Deltaproteobacteria bacterium]
MTAGNRFLEGALLTLDVETIKLTPEEYAANPTSADPVSVVIFDDVTPANLPSAPTDLLFFHPTGRNSPIKIRGDGDLPGPRITAVDEQHPVMKNLDLSNVQITSSVVFSPEPARGEAAVALSVRDAIMAVRNQGGRQIVVVGFALPSSAHPDATDFPLRVSFPLFVANTLTWFAAE